MNNDVIFFTQIAAIVVFTLALFGIYRSLVSHKDGIIELLREQLRQQEHKLNELQSQSPGVLAEILSDRVEITIKEIERLKLDGDKHKEEIEKKEKEILKFKEQFGALTELVAEMDLEIAKIVAESRPIDARLN